MNYIATHLMVYLATFFVATMFAVLWALEPTTTHLVIAGKLWAIACTFTGLVPVCYYCERRAAGE